MDSDQENIEEIEDLTVQHEREEGVEGVFGDDEAVEVQADGENAEAGGEQEEENEENRKVVKPKKVIRNPQPKLNAETLKGTRGLTTLPALFSKQKFRGKHHEKEDLGTLLKTYAYWCHRMFPKAPFEECVERIENLGFKRPTMTYLKRIRLGLIEDQLEAQQAENAAAIEEEELENPLDSQFNELLPTQKKVSELTEEQKERIRINKEKALKIRQDKLRRIQEQAQLIQNSQNASNANQTDQDISTAQYEEEETVLEDVTLLTNSQEGSTDAMMMEVPETKSGNTRNSSNENFEIPDHHNNDEDLIIAQDEDEVCCVREDVELQRSPIITNDQRDEEMDHSQMSEQIGFGEDASNLKNPNSEIELNDDVMEEENDNPLN